MKFYELEIEKDEQTVRNNEDTENIVPYASNSEAERGIDEFPR